MFDSVNLIENQFLKITCNLLFSACRSYHRCTSRDILPTGDHVDHFRLGLSLSLLGNLKLEYYLILRLWAPLLFWINFLKYHKFELFATINSRKSHFSPNLNFSPKTVRVFPLPVTELEWGKLVNRGIKKSATNCKCVWMDKITNSALCSNLHREKESARCADNNTKQLTTQNKRLTVDI